jgi:flavodoxin
VESKKEGSEVMILSGKLPRREVLTSLVPLSLTAGLSLSAGSSGAGQISSDARILVAYFSRTGNTRVIAGQIRRALGADLFEIQPAEAYPEDYEATVSQAQRERDTGYEPPLNQRVWNIGSYQVVFLGFPIWGMTAPPVIRSFLSGHDLSGTTLVPFITHGGYGIGQSLSVVAEHAPRARLIQGFSKQADQERETLMQVTRWLQGLDPVNDRAKLPTP